MKSAKNEPVGESAMEMIQLALQRIELSIDRQNLDVTRKLNNLEARVESVANLVSKSENNTTLQINSVLTTAINQLSAVSQAAIERDRSLSVANASVDPAILGQMIAKAQQQNNVNANQQLQLQQQQQLRLQIQYQQAFAQAMQQQQNQYGAYPMALPPNVGTVPLPPMTGAPTAPSGPVFPVQRPPAAVAPTLQTPQTVAPPTLPTTAPAAPLKPVFPNFNIPKGSPAQPSAPPAAVSLTNTATPVAAPTQAPTIFPGLAKFGTPTPASPASVPATTTTTTPSIFKAPITATTTAPIVAPVETEEKEGEPEEFEPTAHYEPVVPLPELVEVNTGEEGSEVLFEARGKLYRWTDIGDNKKGFKERGLGQVKILRKSNEKHARLVMRREQVLKVCANHFITANCKLTRMTGKPAVTYTCSDFSEGELSDELFSLRFKDDETLNNFFEIFEAQYSAGSDVTPVTSPQKTVSTPATAEATKTEPALPVKTGFGDQFKKQVGEWDCEMCYVRNKATDEFCESCNTGRDGSSKKETLTTFKPTVPAANAPKFSFGLGAAKENTPAAVPPTQTTAPFSFNPTPNGNAEKPNNVFSGLGKPAVTPEVKPATPFAGFGKPATPVSTPATTGGSITTGLSGFSANKPTFGTPAEKTSQKSDALNFSFGKPSSETTKNESPFKFTPQTATPTSTFGGATTAPVSNTASTFGGLKTTGSLFGTSAAPANNSFGSLSSANNSLSFGSLANKASFLDQKSSADANKTFGPQTSLFNKTTSAAKAEGGEDDAPEDFVPDAEYKPVVPLPDMVDVKTGEEGENVLFEHKGKLFIYYPETKETKERGLGPVKILHNPTTDVYRVLMRRDQVHKICANFRLQKNAGMSCGDKPGVRNCCIFRAVDFTDTTEGVNTLFLLRFREEEVYTDFKTQFNNIVGSDETKTQSGGGVNVKVAEPASRPPPFTTTGHVAPALPNIGINEDDDATEDEVGDEDGEYAEDEETEDQELIFNFSCKVTVTDAYTSPMAKNKSGPITLNNVNFTLITFDDEVFSAAFEANCDYGEITSHVPHDISSELQFTHNGKIVSYCVRDADDNKLKQLSIEFANSNNALTAYTELSKARDVVAHIDDA